MKQALNLTPSTTTVAPIDFNSAEQNFVDRITKGWATTNYDVILRILSEQFDSNRHMMSTTVSELVDSISYKIMCYHANIEIEKILAEPNLVNKPVNTKRLSFAKTQLSLGDLHYKVLDVVEKNPGLSRKEIAHRTGISLQSVCARVNELLNDDMLYVCGTKDDTDSSRTVQTLSRK